MTLGSQNVSAYGNMQQFVLVPFSGFPHTLTQAYRAYRHWGLDTRALMQLALLSSRPNLMSDSPFLIDDYEVVGRVRNLLYQTDHLTGSPSLHRQVHRAIDFLGEVGPLLRFRLEHTIGRSILIANVDSAEDDYIIVGVHLPEYTCEYISARCPSPVDLCKRIR